MVKCIVIVIECVLLMMLWCVSVVFFGLLVVLFVNWMLIGLLVESVVLIVLSSVGLMVWWLCVIMFVKWNMLVGVILFIDMIVCRFGMCVVCRLFGVVVVSFGVMVCSILMYVEFLKCLVVIMVL